MALRIDDVAGVSGLIQPNSRVDVMITVADGERQVSKLFMENMRVLSVGTQVQRGEDGQAISAATVALEVTPEEAERLSVAQTRGRIQLVLRGYGDPDSARTRGAGGNEIFDGMGGRSTPVPAAPQAPRPAPRPAAPRPAAAVPAPVVAPPPRVVDDSSTVRVYRGTAVSAVKVEKDSTKKP
jgi:pilus assembly protein CpaB